ncbi:hypothetical protein MANES_S095203v8 [Manihot esculenta]|uniref:Uncharacterized protein n=1 Tax=Manihot esculenta TaxID=3983 RepID=A0ACB7FWV6_MANES|nr:hypothetical protein MANES_S095203v8 [Manihot esculenta]
MLSWNASHHKYITSRMNLSPIALYISISYHNKSTILYARGDTATPGLHILYARGDTATPGLLISYHIVHAISYHFISCHNILRARGSSSIHPHHCHRIMQCIIFVNFNANNLLHNMVFMMQEHA